VQPLLECGTRQEGLHRVAAALRPGGWLLVVALDGSEADALALAARRVRARLWGGGLIGTAEMTTLLTGAGFDSVRAGAPIGAYRTFAARAPGLEPRTADDPPAEAALTA